MQIDTIFDKFGGTRKMAAILSLPSSTVQSWKAKGRIPAGEQARVIELADQHNVSITTDDVIWPLGRNTNATPAAA